MKYKKAHEHTSRSVFCGDATAKLLWEAQVIHAACDCALNNDRQWRRKDMVLKTTRKLYNDTK